MSVYFVLAKTVCRVKIGYSATPAIRVDSIRTSSPDDLMLLGVIDGGLDEERELHRRFVAHHATGEWFHYRGEVKQYIDSLDLQWSDIPKVKLNVSSSPQKKAPKAVKPKVAREEEFPFDFDDDYLRKIDSDLSLEAVDALRSVWESGPDAKCEASYTQREMLVSFVDWLESNPNISKEELDTALLAPSRQQLSRRLLFDDTVWPTSIDDVVGRCEEDGELYFNYDWSTLGRFMAEYDTLQFYSSESLPSSWFFEPGTPKDDPCYCPEFVVAVVNKLPCFIFREQIPSGMFPVIHNLFWAGDELGVCPLFFNYDPDTLQISPSDFDRYRAMDVAALRTAGD